MCACFMTLELGVCSYFLPYIFSFFSLELVYDITPPSATPTCRISMCVCVCEVIYLALPVKSALGNHTKSSTKFYGNYKLYAFITKKI